MKNKILALVFEGFQQTVILILHLFVDFPSDESQSFLFCPLKKLKFPLLEVNILFSPTNSLKQ